LSQQIRMGSTIQSRALRLTEPWRVIESIIEHSLYEGQVVVEPSMGSICHADLRYFSGQRRASALASKLPMALIHEGIGTIVKSMSPELERGQRVLVVPNIPGYMLDGIARENCCPACRSGDDDNYCHRGRFLGSGTDGIAQNRLVVPAACAIPVPVEIPDEIAVLAELCTVSYQALIHVENMLESARVAVFGDGPVGYLAVAVLHHVYSVSPDRLHIFGAVSEKLEQFEYANRNRVQDYDFSSGESFDIVVECTGGSFSESAINQAIEILKPGGHLILMGVTEERVPINTRDVLEKGITLRGSSRSSSSDYHPVLSAMKDPFFQATLRKLIPDVGVKVASAEDFISALEAALTHRGWKKTLLNFCW
jgi:ribitol-5-phosphate 2-dehydrogenase